MQTTLGDPPPPPPLWRDAALGLATTAAMLSPVYAVQLVVVLTLHLPSHHPLLDRLQADPVGNFVAAALVSVLAAPLFEELAFRVMLQGGLERYAGERAWWPILASSAVFAMSHQGQGYAPAPLFVFALGLGYVYRQTHRLAPVVVAHASFNLFSILQVALVSAAAAGPPQ